MKAKRFLTEMKKLLEIEAHSNEAIEDIYIYIHITQGKGNTSPSVLNCWTVQPFGSFGDQQQDEEIWRTMKPVFVHLRHL